MDGWNREEGKEEVSWDEGPAPEEEGDRGKE
jgi:hypothetical protein